MTTITIERDEDAKSPREWDNMGTMIAFHTRYNLGDRDHGFKSSDYNGWDEMEKDIKRRYGRDCLILPLYLYDHSGITMNTTGFSCPWDSGQVGFIVASTPRVRGCMGVKRVTSKVRERAMDVLRSEVDTYDQYLRGDVYYFSIKDDAGNVVEGCGGFYGDDPFTNGMADHVPEELHNKLREAAE